MKKTIQEWLRRSFSATMGIRMIEAEKSLLPDTRYPRAKLWKELCAAACYLDEYVYQDGSILLIPFETAKAWLNDPQPLVDLIDVEGELDVLHVVFDGKTPQVAITGKPKLLAALRKVLPGRVKRKVILHGMTLEELTKALDSL